jgi:hypothetical protein
LEINEVTELFENLMFECFFVVLVGWLFRYFVGFVVGWLASKKKKLFVYGPGQALRASGG